MTSTPSVLGVQIGETTERRPVSITLSLLTLWTCAVIFVYAAQVLQPLAYLHLIAEDGLGEYASALFFGAAGMVFMLKGITQSGFRRPFAILAGANLLVIGGEEISWGQRLLGFATPEALASVNRQGETTLHNIGPLQTFPFHEVAGLALLVVLALAVIEQSGRRFWFSQSLPLPPGAAWPAFVITALVLLLQPFVKGDEISEIFLGATCLIWACFVGRTRMELDRPSAAVPPGALLCSSLAGALLLVETTQPVSFAWRANITASRDYPAAGLYKQADHLYHHILSRPDLILPETRANHDRMHQIAIQQRTADRSLLPMD